MAKAKKRASSKTTMALTKFTIQFKDPDLPESMRKFGEFGEFYSAIAIVNTTTGAGTLKFAKLGRTNG